MFSKSRTIAFDSALIIISLTLFLGVCGFLNKARAQEPLTPGVQTNATAVEFNDPYSHEEIIDFEDDPDLVGHRHEEAASYATYEERTANATISVNRSTPSSSNSTALNATQANSTAPAENPAPAKVVPPKGIQPSALRLFRFIPPTIFDNTIEGMREDEKQTLMDTGETEFWVLTALSEDELVIENKAPEMDTQATLRLFRANNGDTVVAVGVTAGDSCAMELWRYIEDRRALTPMAMPDEPAVTDFFETYRALPEDTDVSMLICLDPVEQNLVAKPLIWTPSGLDQIRLDTRVYYEWDGEKFVKTVEPLE